MFLLYLCPLPFFLFSIVFLREKGGIGRDLYIWGGWGKEKERKRVYADLDDALLALYRELLRKSLYRVYRGL